MKLGKWGKVTSGISGDADTETERGTKHVMGISWNAQ